MAVIVDPTGASTWTERQTPGHIAFVDPNGKLYKRPLRDPWWNSQEKVI